MRIAVISDIHANLQAWTAVYADIRIQDIDWIICLGDMVGYGPAPLEVLSGLYRHVHHFVLGNHDAAVAGLLSTDYFSPAAKQALAWTRSQLGPQAKRFFAELPLSLAADNFRCAHGACVDPGRFSYIDTIPAAMASWQARTEPLFFVGHTHQPRLYELDPTQHCRGWTASPDHPILLRPDCRYIVNCGAVGLSRDGDWRACYAIWDAAESLLAWRRVSYDVDGFIRDLRAKAAVSSWSETVLASVEAPELRQAVDFAPSPQRVLAGKEDAAAAAPTPAPSSRCGGGLARRRRLTAVALAVLTLVALLLLAGPTLQSLAIPSQPRPGHAPAALGEPAPLVGHPPSVASSAAPSIDVNTATVAELVRVPGLGPVLAERIVAYRTQHGEFAHIDELTQVRGIGATTIKTLQSSLHVRESTGRPTATTGKR